MSACPRTLAWVAFVVTCLVCIALGPATAARAESLSGATASIPAASVVPAVAVIPAAGVVPDVSVVPVRTIARVPTLTRVLDAPQAPSPRSHRLDVLSYNVHGLHGIAAKDNPKKRAPLIGEMIAERYSLALLQEDFEHSGKIIKGIGTRPRGYFRGNGSTVKAGIGQRFGQILLWLPAKVFLGLDIPHGSGLTTIAFQKDGFTSRRLVRKPFRVCEGVFSGKNDCLAAKGFLGVRLTGPDGIELDVYNTHLDARGNDPNRGIRREQLSHLAAAIRQYSGERAVIVAGDFNTRRERPKDNFMLRGFQTGLGLRDSLARRDGSWPRGSDVDYILYRSGTGTRLELDGDADAIGEDADFRWRDGSKRLSDHPALFARMRVTPQP